MSEPETKLCDYEFRRDILRVKGVIDFGSALIERAGQVGGWSRATTVERAPERRVQYADPGRTSDVLVVEGSAFAPFEGLLSQAIHSCVHAYKALNPHLDGARDTRYELLRYATGQEFHEHVDVIPGHPEGARQLSIVCFLNDDFRGGELRFSRQDMRIRPVAGDVLLFPSAFTHPHAAEPVLEGTRFVAVTWLV